MKNNGSAFDFKALKESLFSPAGWKAAAVGALGAVAGIFAAGLTVAPFFDFGLISNASFGTMLLGQSLLSMVSGAALSTAILAYDNQAGLRGRWNRDLGAGLLLFAGLSFLSGGLGQLLYSMMGLSRGLPWALMGAGIGMGIGLLRRDNVQAKRGALGGAIGGITGGLLVDGFLQISYTDAAFATASQLGIVITGAMIALFMRAVQQSLRTSWLIGISTGPYLGKEYPLNTGRVTVGKSELNDISLYRETALPPEIGAFVFENGAWYWQGTGAVINGVAKAQSVLQPGDVIQLGTTQFRYQTREVQTNTAPASLPYAPANPQLPVPEAGTAQTPTAQPGAIADSNNTSNPSSPIFTQPGMAAPASTAVLGGAPGTSAVNGATASGFWSLRSTAADGTTFHLPTLNGSVRIGRGPQNSIVLSEPSISSVHADLTMHNSTLAVTDLNSTNGTYINNHRLVPHSLTPLNTGDHLRCGAWEAIVEKV